VCRSPGLIGVVGLHLRKHLQCFGPEVLLVDNPFITNNEALDARNSVLGGHSRQCESANHGSVDNEVDGASRRRWSASLENFVVVPVESAALIFVSLLNGFCDRFARRTTARSVCILPIQPILLPGSADDSLSILVQVPIVVRLGRI